MARLVAAIIARDEQAQLPGSLTSVAWADSRVVILDARTRDRSADVARLLGAVVFHRPFLSFPAQRNAAIQIAAEMFQADWLLFVDADERTSPALAAEIVNAISHDAADAPAGYWIPRRNYVWGGWIKHGGWRPDHQLRLLRIGKVTYDERRDVHELAVLKGPPGYLHEPLVHYNYDTVAQFIRKQGDYTRLEAARLVRDGYAVRPQNFLLQPIREFRRRFFELRGYRDGWRGLLLAALLAWYSGKTYLEMIRLRRSHS